MSTSAMEPPRRPTNYPSDLTESQWKLIEALVPKIGIGPMTPKYNRHDVVNAIMYRLRTGCPWRSLPSDFPEWSTVAKYFGAWNKAGIWDHILDQLRESIRRLEGRDGEPSLAIVDSQSAKTTAGTPSRTRGFDAGKKVKGRKRHIAVDVLGLLLAVSVTSASVQDRDATAVLFSRARSKSARLVKVLADSAYTGEAVALAASASRVDVEIVKRSDDRPGFVPIPKRWVVERTFGWFNFDRVLAKDYEHTTASAEGWVKLAGIYQMVQRCA